MDRAGHTGLRRPDETQTGGRGSPPLPQPLPRCGAGSHLLFSGLHAGRPAGRPAAPPSQACRLGPDSDAGSPGPPAPPEPIPLNPSVSLHTHLPIYLSITLVTHTLAAASPANTRTCRSRFSSRDTLAGPRRVGTAGGRGGAQEPAGVPPPRFRRPRTFCSKFAGAQRSRSGTRPAGVRMRRERRRGGRHPGRGSHRCHVYVGARAPRCCFWSRCYVTKSCKGKRLTGQRCQAAGRVAVRFIIQTRTRLRGCYK